MKNTSVTLPREYWHIYAHSETGSPTYYMLPRPDGFETIAAECASGGPLAATFQAAQLCATASTEAAVDRVDNLTLDEALAVSTFLHEHLRFNAVTYGSEGYVSPYVYGCDGAVMCSLNPDARNGVLKGYCDWLGSYEMQVLLVGYLMSAEEAPVIADLMNELYGLP